MSESQQPNPFSREGSSPSDGLRSDPSPDEAPPPYQQPGVGSNDPYANDWPSYPAEDPYGTPATDPYGRPISSYGGPSANSMYTGPAHGFDSQAAPAYGDADLGYGESSYSNPYETNPYQTSFGGVSPYGVVPATPSAVPHPQATLALILGVLGSVLGLFCIVGGLVGIGGIVVGRRVKNEIDAEPLRYTGRSQAVAGIITGIIGVSICVLAMVAIVLLVVVGISSSGI